LTRLVADIHGIDGVVHERYRAFKRLFTQLFQSPEVYGIAVAFEGLLIGLITDADSDYRVASPVVDAVVQRELLVLQEGAGIQARPLVASSLPSFLDSLGGWSTQSPADCLGQESSAVTEIAFYDLEPGV